MERFIALVIVALAVLPLSAQQAIFGPTIFQGNSASPITGVTAGTGLTGGGISGDVTLSVDSTIIPYLANANVFAQSQTVTGFVNAQSFQVSGNTIFPNFLLGYKGSGDRYTILTDGTGVNGDCVKFDGNLGLSDAGAPCGSGGGGGNFGSLGGGTNTTATMNCGTGCTLGPTGSGAVTANAISGAPNVTFGNIIGANLAGSGTVTFTGIEGSTTNCLQISAAGVVSNTGAACGTGSGTVNSGTGGHFGYYATSTAAISNNANLTDSAGVIGSAEPISVSDGTGTGGSLLAGEGTAPAAAGAQDNLWADSTAHRLLMNNNNGTNQTIPGVASAGTAGHIWTVATDTYGLADGGAVPVSVVGNRYLTGYSQGVAGGGSAGTNSVGGLGGAFSTFNTDITSGALPVMPVSGTVTGMYVSCGITGVNSSSGVFTAQKQAAGSATITAQSMTITYGTSTANTMKSDTTHTFNFAAGDRIGVRVTSQASEDLADCAVTFTY